MTLLTIELAASWLKECTKELETVEEYLTQLDKDVGDADHGKLVVQGFRRVEEHITDEFDSLHDVFNQASKILLNDTDSTAVKLYGIAFNEMAITLEGKEATVQQFSHSLRSAVNKMKKVGNSKRGDKTLIDVWEAMADLAEEKETLRSADFEDKAKSVLKTSKHLMAQKGKASEYGSESVGFLDPGTVSSYYLFLALTNVIEKAENKDSVSKTT